MIQTRLLLLFSCAAFLAAAPTADAITISVAKIDKGAVYVKGNQAEPLSLISWDGTPVAQATKTGAFRFTTTLLPQDCVGEVSDGTSTQPVVIKDCGPVAGIVQGPPGPQGPIGPQGPPGNPGPPSSFECVARAIAGSVAICASGETPTGGGCQTANSATLVSSYPIPNGWACEWSGSAGTTSVLCCSSRPFLGKLGEPCATNGACLSGHCTDHVCCDSSCEGFCERCDNPSDPGFCGMIPDGEDPDSECAATEIATCGHNGACDGKGACAFYAEGTECAPASCLNATKTEADHCDGAGSCVDGGITACSPWGCYPQDFGPVACAFGVCGSVNGHAISCAPGAQCCSGHGCVLGSQCPPQ